MGLFLKMHRTSGSLIIVIRGLFWQEITKSETKIADKSFIDVVSGINENLYSEVWVEGPKF